MNDSVSFLKGAQILGSETLASSFRHDHAVVPADILHHNHVSSHVEHLVILYVEDFPRFEVPLLSLNLLDNPVSLRLVPDRLGTEDHMIS
jgi:hypothetical protein